MKGFEEGIKNIKRNLTLIISLSTLFILVDLYNQARLIQTPQAITVIFVMVITVLLLNNHSIIDIAQQGLLKEIKAENSAALLLSILGVFITFYAAINFTSMSAVALIYFLIALLAVRTFIDLRKQLHENLI